MIKDCASVLRAFIRSLPILGCRIMGLEENLEEFFVGGFVRVVNDFNCFCMPGCFGANLFIGRIRDGATDVARDHIFDALHSLKDCFSTPEASSG